jgi:putative membrane protein
VALAATSTLALAVERVGSTTGVPFGSYRYTPALRPQVAGVPGAVPAAWFAMALPAREAAHAVLGDRSAAVARVVSGAALLTAWDLFLDPQMVGEGYWRWARRGRYRGIPLSNFAGWYATSLAVMALLEAVLPPGDPDPVEVATYAGVAAMHTLGFAVFFGDPLVAAVGGLAMLAPGAVALARLRRRHG